MHETSPIMASKDGCATAVAGSKHIEGGVVKPPLDFGAWSSLSAAGTRDTAPAPVYATPSSLIAPAPSDAPLPRNDNVDDASVLGTVVEGGGALRDEWSPGS